MRKHLLKLTGLFLVMMLFWNCKKEISDKNSDLAVESRSGHSSGKECQLSHVDWGDGSSWDLTYNRKGLLNRWVFNNGDGTQNIFTLQYDHHDRLVRGTAEIAEGSFRIEFKYKGKLLVKEQWYNVADNSLFADKRNHYDRHDRINMQEDIPSHSRVFYTYDNQGNPLTVDLYFDGIIVFSSRFSYEIPNKHPYLSVKGLPYTFPYYDAPSIGKRWESGAKYMFYDDNGTAVVYSNAEAASSIMQKGPQNYLTKLTAFDEVSQSNYIYTFSYQNCHGDRKENNNTPQALKAGNIKNDKIELLFGDRQKIKQKVLEIRKGMPASKATI